MCHAKTEKPKHTDTRVTLHEEFKYFHSDLVCVGNRSSFDTANWRTCQRMVSSSRKWQALIDFPPHIPSLPFPSDTIQLNPLDGAIVDGGGRGGGGHMRLRLQRVQAF